MINQIQMTKILGSAKIHSLLQEMLLNNKNIPFNQLNNGQSCSTNDVSNNAMSSMDIYDSK